MTKKKLQDDVLFGEQDIIAPEPSASSLADSPITESPVDDVSLRLLQTQEKLLSNYELMQQKMDASEQQIARLCNDIVTFKNRQDEFVKCISENYAFHFGISPEALKETRAAFREEVNVIKEETHNCTMSEINRLKHTYCDEESNIDVLRLRWWPHGYILILIIEFLFGGNLLLILKLMGKL